MIVVEFHLISFKSTPSEAKASTVDWSMGGFLNFGRSNDGRSSERMSTSSALAGSSGAAETWMVPVQANIAKVSSSFGVSSVDIYRYLKSVEVDKVISKLKQSSVTFIQSN